MTRSPIIMLTITVVTFALGLVIIPKIMLREQMAKVDWLAGQGEVMQCDPVCRTVGNDKGVRASDGCVNIAHMIISWTAPDNTSYPIYYDTALHECSDFAATHTIPVRYAPQRGDDNVWPVMIGYDWAEEQIYGTGLNRILNRFKRALTDEQTH